MPTAIDALAISIGLDATAFRKGQSEVTSAIRKTRENAVKEGKTIEKAMDDAGEAMNRLARNAVKLFAIFTAGRAVKDFAADITSADAALGRLAKSIGTAPETISALGNAVARNGGSADAAAGSFQRLSDSINELKTTGNTAALPVFAKLQASSGKQIRLNQDLLGTFGDLADAAKGTADRQGTSMATYLLRQAGVDEGTAALLVQGRGKLMEAMRRSGSIGIVRKEDTEAAQRFRESLEALRQTSENFGRVMLTAVTPVITQAVNFMQQWVEKNKEWIQTAIVDQIKQFADYLRSIDWNAVGDGIKSFIAGANDAAKAVGGWKVVAEAFFGLWAASKIAAIFGPVLGSIKAVRLALMNLGPVGWALLGVGSIGAALAEADPNKAIVSGGKNPVGSLNPGDELPGLGGDLRSLGGAGIRTRGRRASSRHAGGGVGGPIPAVPDTVPMTDAERNTLGLILKYESSGRNVMNGVGAKMGVSPDAAVGYTAQGYYQMLNSNWRRIAPVLGIKTRNAMSSTFEEQTRVALYLLRHGGVGNWTNWNARLKRAVAIGEKVSPGRVPAVAPSATAPAPKPSAWNGYPGASDAVAQAQAAQAAMVMNRTMNDNRSSVDQSSQTHFHGDFNIQTAATDGAGLVSDVRKSLSSRAFAMAVNSGQA